jgi:hypothetical protein
MREEQYRASTERSYNGIVVEDKPLSSRIIKVWCQELLPFITGKLTAVEAPTSVNVTETLTNTYQGSAKVKNYIEAEYLDMFSNRQDPPDVVQGEPVKIYQYADSPKYYWLSVGRSDNLRKTEHFRLVIADTTSGGNPHTDDNTYVFEMNSKKGSRHVLLKTCKGTNENYRYQIIINPEEDKVMINDDVGNEIILDSKNTEIALSNKDGTTLSLNKKNLLAIAIEDMVIKAGRQLVFQSKAVSGIGNVLSFNGKSVSLNGSNTLSITGPCIGLNGAVVIPNTLVSGPITAAGYSVGSLK